MVFVWTVLFLWRDGGWWHGDLFFLQSAFFSSENALQTSRHRQQASMRFLSPFFLHCAALCFLSAAQSVRALRFVIDREECYEHDVEYDADTVRLSFVVLKAERAWQYENAVVDLIVEGPNFRRDILKRSDHKFNFIAPRRGVYRMCFRNRSPYHETIDYDVHIGHIPYYEEHAMDDHFDPLLTQIRRLEEAIYSVQFEQHWLQAQTDRQKLLNENLSRRVIHKAILESVGLIAASLLQVYLLRRLFERKLGASIV